MKEFTERENQVIDAAYNEGRLCRFNPVAIQQNKINSPYGIGFIEGALWSDENQKNQWISVNERLPEENTGIFFTVEWKDLHRGYFVGSYYGNGQWESDHKVFLPDSSLGSITHWMPIPDV